MSIKREEQTMTELLTAARRVVSGHQGVGPFDGRAELLRLDAHRLDVTRYADFDRRFVRVPRPETFENSVQFTTLRSFDRQGDSLVDWRQTIHEHVDEFGLGRVIWPNIDLLSAANLWEVVEEIRRRKLWLFNLWGHVPGSDMEAAWCHVVPAPGVVDRLIAELGDRFLGIDNGEQDGRYVWRYAAQQCPSTRDRVEQAANFRRFFRRLGDDLGNRLSVLVSLCFVHHFAKEGNHLLLGAETAQALPNAQIYYAFIRGAGKQYGVPWFGNVSIYNRWGHKRYDAVGQEPNSHYLYGPDQGASLSLMRRLLYTQILGNCDIVGFEGGWLEGPRVARRLTPIGQVQAAAVRWAQRHPAVGVMLRPVGILLDHFCGWTVPRHLYTQKIYQVWGAAPYEEGDFLTHGVFSMLYPRYENASFYHDEDGFLSETPYGDCADVLLSDAPLDVLCRQAVLIVAGPVRVDAELSIKLRSYVNEGGHLVITAGNARAIFPELRIGRPHRVEAGAEVRRSDSEASLVESGGFGLSTVGGEHEVLCHVAGQAAAVRIRRGAGKITLLLSEYGVAAPRPGPPTPIPNQVDQPLSNPRPLLDHVRSILDEVLGDARIFSVNERLGYCVNLLDSGAYLVGVYNNTLGPLTISLRSHIGPICEVTEWPIERNVESAPGYWPTGHQGDARGDMNTIGGGDVRIFEVRVKEDGRLRVLDPMAPQVRPRDRFVALPLSGGIDESVARHPTFFQHFDGLKLDWRYLLSRDTDAIEHDAAWMKRQKLRSIIDLSSGLNFYPDLTLLDTFRPRYEESAARVERVIHRASLLSAESIVLTLHIHAENRCTKERAHERFLHGVRCLAEKTQALGLRLMLQAHPEKWLTTPEQAAEFISEVAHGNVGLALNTGHLVAGETWDRNRLQALASPVRLVLGCAPAVDQFGQWYDQHRPVAESTVDWGLLRSLNVPIVLDTADATWDSIYCDAQVIWPMGTET